MVGREAGVRGAGGQRRGGMAGLHQHTRAELPQYHAQGLCCSPGKPCAGLTASTRPAHTPSACCMSSSEGVCCHCACNSTSVSRRAPPSTQCTHPPVPRVISGWGEALAGVCMGAAGGCGGVWSGVVIRQRAWDWSGVLTGAFASSEGTSVEVCRR